MFDRVQMWVQVEPATALMMIIAAIVLFGAAFLRSKDGLTTFWGWLRRVIEAMVVSLLFLGLLWAFRSILNSNVTTFQSTHGSLSQANRDSAYTIWGGPNIQNDLGLVHYQTVTEKQEIPQPDPTAAPLFREVTVDKPIPQNSMLSFKGTVDLKLSEREKGYAYYNGYEAANRFEYQVVNDSDITTSHSDFHFPLSPNQTMLTDFMVTVDGKDISQQLLFSGDGVSWTDHMKPHEQRAIVVTYKTRGMDYFYYQITEQREVKDFILTLTVDRLPTTLLNYPGGCITPTGIKPTPDGKGSVLTWHLDRAVTTAGMGVALPQPEQPGADVLRTLNQSPYALTLLIATLGLTLLILGEAVHFLDLALLSAVYSLQFLLMAGLSDTLLGFWGSMILGVVLTSFLAFLLYRKHRSRLLRILVSALVLFFALLYPLSGLLSDVTQRNSVDALVQVGLIIYLFALTLYSRLKAGPPQPAQTQPA